MLNNCSPNVVESYKTHPPLNWIWGNEQKFGSFSPMKVLTCHCCQIFTVDLTTPRCSLAHYS